MNSSPVASPITTNNDPWEIAKQAQALKDSEMPLWQQVAINVGIATIGIIGILIVPIIPGSVAAACFIASPVLGVCVGAVSVIAAAVAGIYFTFWLVDQFIISTDKGAEAEAAKIFDGSQGPITNDKVNAFLSIEHLCEEVNFALQEEGYADYDTFYAASQRLGANQLTQASSQLIDSWIKGFDFPLDYAFIDNTINSTHLLDWYCPSPTLKAYKLNIAQRHEQPFMDAVNAGTYTDDDQGRRSYVLDHLPNTYTRVIRNINYISVAQLQKIINGLGKQCTQIKLPYAMRHNPIILQTLAAKGYTVDPQYDSYYRR